jgi:hypothetical protein
LGYRYNFNADSTTQIFLVKLDSLGNVSSSVPELGIFAHVTLFPNPGNSHLTVQCADPQKAELFYLYDFSGRLVLARPLQEFRTPIETESLQCGIYFYKITDRNGNTYHSGKWIKQ